MPKAEKIVEEVVKRWVAPNGEEITLCRTETVSQRRNRLRFEKAAGGEEAFEKLAKEIGIEPESLLDCWHAYEHYHGLKKKN